MPLEVRRQLRRARLGIGAGVEQRAHALHHAAPDHGVALIDAERACLAVELGVGRRAVADEAHVLHQPAPHHCVLLVEAAGERLAIEDLLVDRGGDQRVELRRMRHGAGAHGGIAAQCVDVLARQRDARARLGGGDPPALGHEQQGTANDEVNHPGHGGNVPDGRSRQRTTWRAPFRRRLGFRTTGGSEICRARRRLWSGGVPCAFRSRAGTVRSPGTRRSRRHRARVVRVPVVVLPRLERLPPGVDRLGSIPCTLSNVACVSLLTDQSGPTSTRWIGDGHRRRPQRRPFDRAIARTRASCSVSISARIGYDAICVQYIGHLCGFGCGCPGLQPRLESDPHPILCLLEGGLRLDATHQWSGPQSLQLHTGDFDLMPHDNYERLSALDNAFLVLERANTPMHVGSTAIFDAAPLLRPRRRRRLRTLRAGTSRHACT